MVKIVADFVARSNKFTLFSFRLNLCESEAINNIKGELGRFEERKDYYMQDVESQKNTLTNMVQLASQQINNEVNKVLEKITDKKLEER